MKSCSSKCASNMQRKIEWHHISCASLFCPGCLFSSAWEKPGKSNAWDLSNACIADGWHRFPALLTLLPYFEETNKQPLSIPTVRSQDLSFYAQLCSVFFLREALVVSKSLGTLWLGSVVPQPGIPAVVPGCWCADSWAEAQCSSSTWASRKAKSKCFSLLPSRWVADWTYLLITNNFSILHTITKLLKLIVIN